MPLKQLSRALPGCARPPLPDGHESQTIPMIQGVFGQALSKVSTPSTDQSPGRLCNRFPELEKNRRGGKRALTSLSVD